MYEDENRTGQTADSSYTQPQQQGANGGPLNTATGTQNSAYGQSAQNSAYGQSAQSSAYGQSIQNNTYGQSAQNSTYGQSTQGSTYGQNGSAYSHGTQSTGAYTQSQGASYTGYRAGSAYSDQSTGTYRPGVKPAKEKKSFGTGKKILVALACGLVFGLVAGTAIYGVNYVGNKFFPATDPLEESRRQEISDSRKGGSSIEQTQPIIPEAEPRNAATGDNVLDASQVVEECMPSIVAITNKSVQYYQGFWGFPEQYESEASGSGIIVGENDEELLVVTNGHVIDGASELTVQFNDGESYDAQIKGSKDDQDLAIIAIKLSDISDSTMKSLKVATLGDSDTLKVGEPVIAIGNSLGYGQTVTSGIVSALDRDFSYDNNTRQVIQTDAAINPGNSGGALLNLRGEVVGINEAKFASTSVEGVGYAIPISTARPIIDDLVTKTTRSKVDESNAGFLGVYGADVTEEAAQTYGMPRGVYVAQVTEGSAAEKGGIVKGDIITEFAGESVSTMEELKSTVGYYAAGTEVEVKIQRMGAGGYEESVIKVTLGKREAQE